MPAIDARFYQTRWGVVALATLCCLLWGSAYPAIKNGYALLSIAPGDIASQVLFLDYDRAHTGLVEEPQAEEAATRENAQPEAGQPSQPKRTVRPTR